MPEADNNSYLNPKLTRRTFNWLVLFGGSSLINLACQNPTIRETPAPPTGKATTHPTSGTRKVIPQAEGLKQAISDLPPASPIKDLLVNRILEYYSDPAPTQIVRSGVPIRIFSPSVTVNISDNTPTATGLSRMYNSNVWSRLQAPAIDRDTSILIPYVGAYKPDEVALFPKDQLTTDKTPAFYSDFKKGNSLYDGISPQIVLYIPRGLYSPSNRSQLDAATRFLYIKEASNLLIEDIWFEEVIKKMQELGLNTQIPVVDQTGKAQEFQGITQSEDRLSGAKGRLAALVDLGGYILAFKAIQGTKLEEFLLSETVAMEGAIKAVQKANLGSTAKDILLNTFDFILGPNRSSLNGLSHIGSLNNLP